MAKKDFIIVGQGLAGSVLAYLLWKKGKKVVVIDRKTDDEWTSSRIAAGVISPITGWRFVKSWRIDEFLPAARAVYRGIETDLNIKIWHDRRLIRTIRNAEEQNNFQLRRAFVDYQPYISEAAPSVSKAFQPSDFGFLELTNAAQVNVPLLVECFQKFFRKNNLFETDDFDFHKLKLSDNTVFYKNHTAQKAIFADGAAGATNPFFSALPFNLDKGDLLLVKIPNLNLTHIFKNKISIVPLHDTSEAAADMYWVGATNDWNFTDALPTDANKQLIINELQAILNIPFEIIAHQSAVRPTVKDRRPFIGFSEKSPQVGIFNGFGTKGASLVPYWARHFCDVLCDGIELDSQVDIRRFR